MTQLSFKTNCRVVTNRSSSSRCSVLLLPPQFKLTTNPWFVCDGNQRGRSFQVNEKISLLGFGFLGPIDADANFEVTVKIMRIVNCSYTFDSGTFTKNSFAREGKIFHFLLDEPIVVESSTTYGLWGNHYDIIYFSLKGPNNIAQYQEDNPKDESLEASGVQFHFHSIWNNGNPLAELLFKKI